MDSGPLADIWYTNIFSYIIFLLSQWYPLMQKRKILVKSDFSWIAYAFGPTKLLPQPKPYKLAPMFSSMNLIVLPPTFRSLIYLNFCIWYEVGVQTHSSICRYSNSCVFYSSIIVHILLVLFQKYCINFLKTLIS